jgi:plastocyanin
MDLRRPLVSILLVLVGTACSLAERPEATPADRRPSPAAAPVGQAPAGSDAAGTGGRLVDPRHGGLELGFGEFAITLEADEIRPGPVTFVVRNGGQLVHGFEIEIEERDSSGPGSGDGLKLEGPAFGPGEVIRIPARLGPGVYEIECFVAEHDDMGMRATLVVRRGAPLVSVEPEREAGRVSIADFAFGPVTIEARIGDELTWANDDPTAHTVTAENGAFDSGTLEPGTRFVWVADRPGTFAYLCQIHPTMRGTVRVAAS